MFLLIGFYRDADTPECIGCLGTFYTRRDATNFLYPHNEPIGWDYYEVWEINQFKKIIYKYFLDWNGKLCVKEGCQ